MKAIDDLKEVYPELEIFEVAGCIVVRGAESEVDLADARMDQYIPTKYKRLMHIMQYETNISTRSYRRVA